MSHIYYITSVEAYSATSVYSFFTSRLEAFGRGLLPEQRRDRSATPHARAGARARVEARDQAAHSLGTPVVSTVTCHVFSCRLIWISMVLLVLSRGFNGFYIWFSLRFTGLWIISRSTGASARRLASSLIRSLTDVALIEDAAPPTC